MRWDHIKDGSFWVEQGKIKARLQIDIVGELVTLIDRIKSRGIVGMTLLSDPKGQQLKHSGYLRSQVKLARDRAEAKAAELGINFVRFQFRDLRAKSASDMESMAKPRKLLGTPRRQWGLPSMCGHEWGKKCHRFYCPVMPSEKKRKNGEKNKNGEKILRRINHK